MASMTRPAPFLVVILGLMMVVAACDTATTTPGPGQTQLPGVDSPAPDPGSSPAAPGGTPTGPGGTPAGPGGTPAGPGATAPPGGAPGGILAAVQARGSLVCGVNGGLPGFSFLDPNGVWSGFDVDYCRAVAAAVLGDPDAVEYRQV